MHKITLDMNSNRIIDIFGHLDENAKIIEKSLAVSITNRGDNIIITGEHANAQTAEAILHKLVSFSEKKDVITTQTVNYLLSESGHTDFNEIEKIKDDIVCFTANGKPIRPKTLSQKKYIDQIRKNTIVFGTGPAGTGKTYLAMAMAITDFKRGVVNRIILTRPAIEAGEKLGFLPGDLQQKVDPYLRPLYDALHEIMGQEAYVRNIEKGLIEIAPLAYMRGRTLDNSFIVLDEAQNTTHEQMKMFLTRVGFGSKVVVTGDLTQIDLPRDTKSGLAEAVSILSGIDGIGITALSNKDIVRHPLVAEIIAAYERNVKDKQKVNVRHERRPETRNRRPKRF